MSFEQLEIINPIHKALTSEGYETPTPIQLAAIPKILEGRDILGSAQTGTGKTAAFAVPILQLLHTEKAHANKKKVIHALILSPTRELALQIGESFSTYGRLTGLTNVVVFGGVPQKAQTDALKKGVDILVATPGRLLDLLDQKFINLSHVQIFVLDEADRMLDMGFIHDIKKVLEVLPEKRQNLLFSATIPPEIAKLSESILHDPVTIEITPDSPTVDAIRQGVYFVAKINKKRLLLHVLEESKADSVLVFTRTKYGAEYVARFLQKAGISADAIHSDKVQK
ncbi:MAG: DEAD/DEAH box helicase, partial [Ignavibacteriales bacterium]|nr:DEAD/DEAH box helicase [Ignavibacteriales bacterium]